MRRKSVGIEVPPVPSDELARLDAQQHPDPHPADQDRDEAESQRLDVGPPNIGTWFPSNPEDLPSVYFATKETVDDIHWLVRGELIPDKDAQLLKLRRLTIEPWDHDGEVTSNLVRELHLGPIRDRAILRVRALASRPAWSMTRGTDASDDDWWPDFPPETPMYAAHAEVERNTRSGRPALDPTLYRQAGVWYLELFEGGTTRGVHHVIGKRFGRPWQTSRDWVHEARELGYISPGIPGRTYAAAGPRLLAELRAAFDREHLQAPSTAIARVADEFGVETASIERWLALALAEQTDEGS